VRKIGTAAAQVVDDCGADPFVSGSTIGVFTFGRGTRSLPARHSMSSSWSAATSLVRKPYVVISRNIA
jgi:hypothetical protein